MRLQLKGHKISLNHVLLAVAIKSPKLMPDSVSVDKKYKALQSNLFDTHTHTQKATNKTKKKKNRITKLNKISRKISVKMDYHLVFKK